MQSTNNDQHGSRGTTTGRVTQMRIALILGVAFAAVALAIAVPRGGEEGSTRDTAQASTTAPATESFEDWFLRDLGTRGATVVLFRSATAPVPAESFEDWFLRDLGTRGDTAVTSRSATAPVPAETFEDWFLSNIGTRVASTGDDRTGTWYPLHEASLDEILYLVWNGSGQ